MRLTSPAFEHNNKIPNTYTCDGEDINPPLEISEVPDDAESLVLIVDDPDAPAKTWVHWVVYNIHPETAEIEEDSVPSGAKLGVTDFGHIGYGGPCPPSGEHRYRFKLYALNTILELDDGATKEQVEQAMEIHIMEQTELLGLYERT